MEKIFIFIIIMIISSVISKNKKKKAAEKSYVAQTKTTYFDQKGRTVSKPQQKPVENLRDMFSSFQNKIKEEIKVQAVTSENNYIEEAVIEKPYESRFPERSAEQTYDKIENSYDNTGSPEVLTDRLFSYDTVNKDTLMNSNRNIAAYHEKDNSKENRSSTIAFNFFNTKSKLKNAIIASEILGRRY